MLKRPANRKLSAIKTIILNPAKSGFQIRMKEKTIPKNPRINNPPQFLFPYLFISKAKLIEATERKRIPKPMYNANTVIESFG